MLRVYLYAKNPYEAKCQYLIKIREKVGINLHNDPRAFTSKNISDYNPDPENKTLIVSDDMIADMINNRRLDSIVIELFISGRKLNMSLVFITQSYFKVPEDVRLNTTHFLIAKIPNEKNLQKIAINHSSDISTKDFINYVLVNHILYLLLILRLHQIIL